MATPQYSAQDVKNKVDAQNTSTFDKIINYVNKGASTIGTAPAKIVTGASDELTEGASRAITNITGGVQQGLTDFGEGTEAALYGTSRGLAAVGEVGLKGVTSGIGEGLGEGLESIGTGAGKGLLSFSKALIPVAVFAGIAFLAFGLSKGVSKW